GSGQAQAPGSLAAALASPPASAAVAAPPACVVGAQQARFDLPLPRLARLIASGAPVKIVALGSSSTFGAGASTSAASYPSRLAESLGRRSPAHKIAVLTGGASGDEPGNRPARLDTAVIAEKPDLVLWQVGTNSVLRDHAVLPHATLLFEGLSRLKAAGAE